jgi:phage baseplate assembly protein W
MSNLLGTGFAFPPLPDPGFATVSGADAVAQSLVTLLLTEPGERIGRPTYGVGLKRYLFAPNNVGTRTLIQQSVADAVKAQEPRAILLGVDALPNKDEPTRIDLTLRYRLLTESSPRNLVYPFYLDGRGL